MTGSSLMAGDYARGTGGFASGFGGLEARTPNTHPGTGLGDQAPEFIPLTGLRGNGLRARVTSYRIPVSLPCHG